jgi:ferredoxin/coenzyme F420-reducing hydrogenase delta subunit
VGKMHRQTVTAPRHFGKFLLSRIDRGLDSFFGEGLSPLRHLGSLCFLLFWMVAVSGIYLYAVLDTSATGAYRSINDLSQDQWYLGGLLRSIHRYAADGFVVTMIIHLVREWVLGHFHGFRRFSWLTGVPLLVFGFASGIGGFWLNWDQLGQFSAQATAEWLDTLPIFASPLTRNFLNAGAVSDRLFSLFVFIHLGLPLLLLFGSWFHIQRISLANVFPPRALTVGIVATIFALAAVQPVISHLPADLSRVPSTLAIDWFLLFIHPLMYVTSSKFIWYILTGVLFLLLLIPFLPRSQAAPVARVDPDNCNGCRRCFDDCPYAAVTMVPHPNRRMARQLAQVDSDLCASCGICVGSCPSSTPFRSVTALVTGIDLPHSPISHLRQKLKSDLANLKSDQKIVVFGCDQGANVDVLRDSSVATFSLVCAGMLPPSFVEYALRDGASGVLVTGCQSGGCEFRLGQQWTRARLERKREPSLRASVARDSLQIVWADVGDEAVLKQALSVLQLRVASAHKQRATVEPI